MGVRATDKGIYNIKNAQLQMGIIIAIYTNDMQQEQRGS